MKNIIYTYDDQEIQNAFIGRKNTMNYRVSSLFIMFFHNYNINGTTKVLLNYHAGSDHYQIRINWLYLAKYLSKPKYSISNFQNTIAKPKTSVIIILLLFMCGDTGASINPGPRSCLCDLGPNNTGEVNFNERYLCASVSLPFHDVIDNSMNTESNRDLLIPEQSLTNPSKMPDSAYECFKRRGLHLIHINARSIIKKMSEIRILAEKTNPAILAITETWFDNSVPDKSVEIENYNIIRKDRLTRSGGVCMYIRSDLAYNRKNELENDDFEDLWLELLLPKSKPIFVGTCYRAPKNKNLIDSLESTLSKMQPDCETIILGDFNICLLNNSNFKNKYIDTLNSYNFSQLIEEPTRVTQSSASLIDHIHSNNTEKICQSGVIKSGISDHYITYCTRKVVRGQINMHNTVKVRFMKNYSKEKYNEILESLDWSLVTIC